METVRIMPATKFVYADRTDEIGTCLIDERGHFYRQDKDKVLHVNDGLVNILDVNHIETARQSWGDKFEKITEKEFNSYLQAQLNRFFE